MRTKTLLLAAALSAAGLATSLAQNVYSLNVVGYVNLTLPTNGVYLVANQLDLDGTGTNNTLTTVLGTNVPNNTTVYVWDGTSWNWNAKFFAPPSPLGWQGNANITTGKKGLQPGEAFFLQNPTANPMTVTMVGNVLQPKCWNITYPLGVTPVSSPVPQAGKVETELGFALPTTGLNRIYRHINAISAINLGGTYANILKNGATWPAGEPSVNVGEAFLLSCPSNAPTFSRCFTVQ